MSVFLTLTAAERDSGLLAPHRVKEAFERFLTSGCLILQQLFRPETVEALAQAYAAQLSACDPETLWKRSLTVGHRRVIMPLALSGPFGSAAFYAPPVLCQLLEKLLDTHFVLGSSSVVLAMPGAQAQRSHRDNNLLFGDSRASLMMPTYAITVGLPLIALTPQTGTTALYPGSHQELLPARIYAQPPLEPQMQLGDVYLFDARLMHHGTPNPGEQPRPIVYLTYARNWFLDVENYLLNHTNAVIADGETLRNVPAARPQLLQRARLRLQDAID